jgi:peptidoglycan/LPS O-acetylase OafA/YrhL
MNAQSSSCGKTISSLTSLRFFAISIVVLHHFRELIGWGPAGGWGAIGVTFFFILSGFVITISNCNIKNIFDAKIFLIKRLIRIYPLYIITFIISYFLIQKLHLKIDASFLSAMANIFLIQSWIKSPDVHFSFNSLGWAVSTLFFFYLAFSIIQLNFRKNVLIFSVACLFSLCLSVYYLNVTSVGPLENHWLLHMFPLNRLFVFILGVFLAHFYMLVTCYVNNLPRGLFSFFEILCLVLIFDALFLSNFSAFIYANIPNISGLKASIARQMLDVYFITPFICSFFIFIFSFEMGFFSKILSKKFFIFFGEVSFPIYLIHQIVFRYFSRVGEFSVSVTIVMAVAFVILFSVFYHVFVDKYLTSYLKKYLV